METRIDGNGAGSCRLSTHLSQIEPPAGFTFNQFLILGDATLV